VYLVIIQL